MEIDEPMEMDDPFETEQMEKEMKIKDLKMILDFVNHDTQQNVLCGVVGSKNYTVQQ